MPDPKKYRMRVGGYSQHPGDVAPPAPQPKDLKFGSQLHPALDPNSSNAELEFQRAKDKDAAKAILNLALRVPDNVPDNVKMALEQDFGQQFLNDAALLRQVQASLGDSAISYRRMADVLGEEEASRIQQEASNGRGQLQFLDAKEAEAMRRLLEMLPPNENLVDIGQASAMQTGRISKYRDR